MNRNDDDNDDTVNPWESAKNDSEYRQQQQEQGQGSGERTREGGRSDAAAATAAAAAASNSRSWHDDDYNDAAVRQRQEQQQQDWSGDVVPNSTTNNMNSMETTGRRHGGRGNGSNSSNHRHGEDEDEHHRHRRCFSSCLSCWCGLLRKLAYPQSILFIMDWSFIVATIVDIAVIRPQSSSSNNNGNNSNSQHALSTEEIIWICGTVLTSVFIFLRFGLSSSTVKWLSERHCSKVMTVHLTMLIGISYGILALDTWIDTTSTTTTIAPWCPSLPTSQPSNTDVDQNVDNNNNIEEGNDNDDDACRQNAQIVPIVFLVMFVIEIMRYIYARGVLGQYREDHTSSSSTTGLPQSPNSTISSPYYRSRRNRPWWWNRHAVSNVGDGNNEYGDDYDDDPLRERLIHGQPGWTQSGGGSYMVDDGIGTPRRRPGGGGGGGGGLLGWMTGSSNDNDNPRDDGSVDYASLSEDWASRSEEDPYWWTRSENTTS